MRRRPTSWKALNGAFAAGQPGAAAIAGAADHGVAELGAALQTTLATGIASGDTAFQALLNGLQTGGGSLAVAVNSAIASFATPADFVNALVAALSQISANLGVAVQVALQNLSLDVNIHLDASAIADALANAGAQLTAAFNAAVALFPNPAAFVNAVTTALSTVIPGLAAAATAAQALVTNLSTAWQARSTPDRRR